MGKLTDEWQTPNDLFLEYDREFNFVLDLCANAQNKKTMCYLEDYLNCDVKPAFIKACYYELGLLSDLGIFSAFMNPPYSNPKPFIEKAWSDSKDIKIVCLVKADTSTKWWATFWDYENHKAKAGCEVRFLPKRIKFIKPDGTEAGAANFPSAIIIMDRRNIQ